jgi:hypothetical protein
VYKKLARERKLLLALALLSPPALLSSCASDTSGPAPALPEAQEVIGATGGTCEVDDGESPLYGVKIVFPAGALSTEQTIEIWMDVIQPQIPAGLAETSPVVRFEPDGLAFNQPVAVSIPYDPTGIDEDMLAVFKYDAGRGQWRVTAIADLDTMANIVTGATLSLSLYQVLGLPAGTQLPSAVSLDFNPSIDGLRTQMNVNNCLGEAGFVQWFWIEKRSTSGGLVNWHPDEHYRVAEYAQDLLWKSNPVGLLRYPVSEVARLLVLSLAATDPAPQMISISTGTLTEHALLVYGYTVTGDHIDFLTYDSVFKAGTLNYSDGEFSFQSVVDTDAGYGGVLDAHREMDFLFEYVETPPEVTDMEPTGDVHGKRPLISARIHYPYVSADLVEVTLNDDPITVRVQRVDDHTVVATYQPSSELREGQHRVSLEAMSDFSTCDPSSGDDDIDPVTAEWSFTILGGEALLPGTWDLVAIRSISEDGWVYDVPKREIEADPLTYVLNSNHTGVQIYQDRNIDFYWDIEGGMLIFYTYYSEQYYIYEVDSSRLRLTFEIHDEYEDQIYTITHTFERRS